MIAARRLVTASSFQDFLRSLSVTILNRVFVTFRLTPAINQPVRKISKGDTISPPSKCYSFKLLIEVLSFSECSLITLLT